ncbi:MAG: glycosyl hydrolase [Opitutales bacterium]|jgi:exo-beta-1,3-glucanase (GH17 family)|nr:glycosyl hydrolase [Opitutales bacterium]MBT5170333.1 glycosyl hydrolase [Opitutales bacterium]MBT5815363.1 glycosyl hydrolase [Opitutales bacterium]MBT6381092.1 glycosyl hydrolase [Opitutales bacterium]MBT6770605.1 glycosyl hydrolase [Opitutales bacterium]
MSSSEMNIMALAGTDYLNASEGDLRTAFGKLLDARMHGLCFSPYANDQRPGSELTSEQIQSRLEIIKPYTNWVRTFSCADGNERIPRIAHENGLKTMVGAWLGKDLGDNEKEIANLIEIARAGYADNVAVGNEVLYRDDLSEEQLIAYIDRVKKALPELQVGYVDAYYEFVNRPLLTDACDVVFANCYPYWEGCDFEYSLLYMKDMYHRVSKAAKGKKVVISETGWPSQGTAHEAAEPSVGNALKYFINTQEWARDDDLEVFYFSSFDEDWKIGDEGDVGAYWGIWDKNGELKFE